MSKMRPKSYHLLFFFLQPFVTTLYYLRHFNIPHAKNVMWLFSIFYGATFAIGVENSGSDIVRYMEDVENLNRMGLDLQGILQYFKSSGEVDISRTLLAVIVSFFTSNGFYLIIVFGAIYGYFFSRNMWYILDRVKGKTRLFTKLLLFCLFLTIPLWNMNGFRFWTATHIFLYGLLPFLFEGNKKSLIWCFITPFLMHFGYLIALLPLCIYLIVRTKLKMYFAFLIITIFVSNINISQFNDIINTYAPTSIVERSEAYRVVDKVEDYRSGEYNSETVWYAKYYGKVYSWILTAFLILIFLLYYLKRINLSKSMLSLFAFTLLFYGFANMMSSIPSGARFTALANLLSVSFIILSTTTFQLNRSINLLSKITTPFLLFYMIVAIRLSWYSLSVMSIIGNPFMALFTFGENTALNDVIKGL